jgi:hypothetical protein
MAEKGQALAPTTGHAPHSGLLMQPALPASLRNNG